MSRFLSNSNASVESSISVLLSTNAVEAADDEADDEADELVAVAPREVATATSHESAVDLTTDQALASEFADADSFWV